MNTAPIIKFATLTVAAAMLAACGGGDYPSERDAGSRGGTVNGNSATSTSSIGGLTISNVDSSNSTYQGERF